MERAAGVVAMGGYNTFCEILSFDKKALIVPRTRPRLEQFIRAARAAGARPGRDAAEDGRSAIRRSWRRRCASCRSRACRRGRRCPGLLDGLEQRQPPGRAAGSPAAAGRARRRRPLGASSASAERRDAACRQADGCARRRRPEGLSAAVARPSSPRRSRASRRAGSRSGSSRCAGRPTRAPPGAPARSARRVLYLPEYLKDEPLPRAARLAQARRLPGYRAARARLARRPAARPDAQPVRRFGQALVLAAELPARHRPAARAFPAHARLGRALCRADARPAVERARRMPRTSGPARTGRCARSSPTAPGW